VLLDQEDVARVGRHGIMTMTPSAIEKEQLVGWSPNDGVVDTVFQRRENDP
jgi:hypothetical protein